MKRYILILLLFPSILFAQEGLKALEKKGIDTKEYIPKGIKVGEKAPEIRLTSVAGKIVISSEILKEKELVVIFYRGKWCPVCEKYLSNLNDSLSYILDKNAEVLVVGPETFENANKIANNTKADFILLPDTTLKVLTDFDVMFNVNKGYVNRIKTLKMTDIASNNNQDVAQLPVPATYIIGQDGNIKWRHFDYNYSNRASVKSIIEHLK